MISFIRKGILIIMACVGGVIGGCESKKVPLNKEQFTNLLIDLHKVDGTLSVRDEPSVDLIITKRSG